MSDHHTYRKIEVVGSSAKGTDDAIRNALAQCSKTIKHIAVNTYLAHFIFMNLPSHVSFL